LPGLEGMLGTDQYRQNFFDAYPFYFSYISYPNATNKKYPYLVYQLGMPTFVTQNFYSSILFTSPP